MSDIQKLREIVTNFRDARDWKQFHNPKDVTISLMLEAAELVEHFQWKSPAEMEEHLKNHKDAVAEELADVLYWVLLISHDFDINLQTALEKKIKQNEAKYPIDKAKGKHTKYNKL